MARATTSKKQVCTLALRRPLASATSGTTEDSMSGRKSTAMAAMQPMPSSATGSSSLVLTPRTSPKRSEYTWGSYSVVRLRNRAPRARSITSARAVTTSLRPRRPSDPMPRAASTEKAASPTSGLSPTRLANAAPAKAPFGIACAWNAAPRSTTKNPTMPATTATIVALVQALTMKPENMAR